MKTSRPRVILGREVCFVDNVFFPETGILKLPQPLPQRGRTVNEELRPLDLSKGKSFGSFRYFQKPKRFF